MGFSVCQHRCVVGLHCNSAAAAGWADAGDPLEQAGSEQVAERTDLYGP